MGPAPVVPGHTPFLAAPLTKPVPVPALARVMLIPFMVIVLVPGIVFMALLIAPVPAVAVGGAEPMTVVVVAKIIVVVSSLN
jgi:hypothetical protein